MIAIVDYGMGNCNSVLKAFKKINAAARITSMPEDLDGADKIVLPGVGSFGMAMRNLNESGMTEALHRNVRKSNKLFLGICLGMHLTAAIGLEDGNNVGLEWIENSSVEKFSNITPLKVPHVGWNDINIVKAEHPIVKGISNNSDFYFVHSYHYICDSRYIVAECNYGYNFPAIIAKDNIFAAQFHPEKSQEAGLKLLKNFAELKEI